MPRGPFTPGTANYIRDALVLQGESWTSRITRDVQRWCSNGGYKVPKNQTIRKFLYCLTRLGLVVRVRTEPVPGKPWLKPRHVYALVDGLQLDPRWRDPQTALYDPEKFAERTEFRAQWSNPKDYYEWVRLQRSS